MIRLILTYATFELDVGFLLFKKEYLNDQVWLTSFYIHVFSSVLCLAAGLTQFSKTILKFKPRLHRTIGRVYVFNILIINFPTAMIMAFYADGLIPTKAAFVILDSMWFYFTLRAFLEIKKGNVDVHRRFMIRSFALTFSAVTLRGWNVILSTYTQLDALSIYMIDGWLGFVPNLVISELYLRLEKSVTSSSKFNLREKNH